ncbi:helix-turn-helix domain-containing protein [Roseibium sp. MMSF_3412]|uniref:helix-turn-helix domain-containing protein n=1 Tax=Roseibium sp. MMSF_3412 TaxID=3046712 RepID=UPI00273FE7F1|nr:helix-turn-helix domain-containing protein [Roseibium sp. MMSF_3412]
MTTMLHDLETAKRFNRILNCAGRQDLEQFVSLLDERANLVQLSAGPFSGSAFKTDFPLVSVQLERCNQDIEKEVSLGKDELAFTICVPTGNADISRDRIMQARDCVIVQTPGCKNVSILPAGTMQLTIKVSKSAFLEHHLLCPQIRDWLTKTNGKVEFLHSERFASRLRDVGGTALEISANDETPARLELIGRSFVLGLVGALTLEWLSKQSVPRYQRTKAFNCFQTARNIVLEGIGEASDPWTVTLERLGSRRTVEKAFAKLINMGPAMYARVLRLNNARRKILDDANTEKSIGDIAAEEGFWDWSRFTAYYRKQFGELPSVTRSKFLLSK